MSKDNSSDDLNTGAIDFSDLKKIGAAEMPMIEAMRRAHADPNPENEAIARNLWEQARDMYLELESVIRIHRVRFGGPRTPAVLGEVILDAGALHRELPTEDTKYVTDALLAVAFAFERKADVTGRLSYFSYETTKALVVLSGQINYQREEPSIQNQNTLIEALGSILTSAELQELKTYLTAKDDGKTRYL